MSNPHDSHKWFDWVGRIVCFITETLNCFLCSKDEIFTSRFMVMVAITCAVGKAVETFLSFRTVFLLMLIPKEGFLLMLKKIRTNLVFLSENNILIWMHQIWPKMQKIWISISLQIIDSNDYEHHYVFFLFLRYKFWWERTSGLVGLIW